MNTYYGGLSRLRPVLANLQKEFGSKLIKLKGFKSTGKLMSLFLMRECSPIVAQRIVRSYQAIKLHAGLWANSIGSSHNSRKFVLGLVLYSLCQPMDTAKIRDLELIKHMDDLDFIHELTAATVVCPSCKDRLVIDNKIAHVRYCSCPENRTAYDRKIEGYGWTPFAETPDLLIWRQPHPDYSGQYMYKVYGYYDDLSPMDFLDIQLDIEYRRTWDNHALKLEVIEEEKSTNSSFIYWEMKWPTMFANRDYVYARRHMIDKKTNTVIILNRAVELPNRPEVKNVHRVKDYWSVMQIRGVSGLSEPGVEFGLTYFDNPGVSLPSWLTTWAAMSGIPDFLDKQRLAAREKFKTRTRKSSKAKTESPSKSNPKIKQTENTNTPKDKPDHSSSKCGCRPEELSSPKLQETPKVEKVNENEEIVPTPVFVEKKPLSNPEAFRSPLYVQSSNHDSNDSGTSLVDRTKESMEKRSEGGASGEILSQFFKRRILETL